VVQNYDDTRDVKMLVREAKDAFQSYNVCAAKDFLYFNVARRGISGEEDD